MKRQPTNVIDLARFLADREQRRLPLFDRTQPARLPLPVQNAPLSDRQAQHRARMLRYLTRA